MQSNIETAWFLITHLLKKKKKYSSNARKSHEKGCTCMRWLLNFGSSTSEDREVLGQKLLISCRTEWPVSAVGTGPKGRPLLQARGIGLTVWIWSFAPWEIFAKYDRLANAISASFVHLKASIWCLYCSLSATASLRTFLFFFWKWQLETFM